MIKYYKDGESFEEGPGFYLNWITDDGKDQDLVDRDWET